MRRIAMIALVGITLAAGACQDATAPKPTVVATYSLSHCIAAYENGDTLTVPCGALKSSTLLFHDDSRGTWSADEELWEGSGTMRTPESTITYGWADAKLLLITPRDTGGSGITNAMDPTQPFHCVQEGVLVHEFALPFDGIAPTPESFNSVVYQRVSGDL